jgi:hypothetical protein
MKKTISVVLIAVSVISALMLVVGQHVAQANTIHWTYKIGYDYDLPGGYDAFVECVHTDWQSSDDTYVAFGMQAWYDVDLYNNYGDYGYDEAQWTFEAGYGYDYDEGPNRFYTYPLASHSVNQYGYFAGSSYYMTQSPWWQGGVKLVRSYYPSQGSHQEFSPHADAISCQSYAAFYDPNNPGNIWYLSASPPPENSYDVLTAQAGPPEEYSWDD